MVEPAGHKACAPEDAYGQPLNRLNLCSGYLNYRPWHYGSYTIRYLLVTKWSGLPRRLMESPNEALGA